MAIALAVLSRAWCRAPPSAFRRAQAPLHLHVAHQFQRAILMVDEQLDTRALTEWADAHEDERCRPQFVLLNQPLPVWTEHGEFIAAATHKTVYCPARRYP
ncbi:MAG: hypothetical protein H6715_02545 [Myxococcales bacterium]|nr:hypothetical protein [Myxococcales bacterium]